MPSVDSGSKPSARTGSRFFHRLDRSATERYLSAVLDYMTEGLILARPDGQIKAMNRAALRMHDLADATAIEGPFSRLAELIELRDAYDRQIDINCWPIARAVRGETFTGDEVEVVDRRTGRRWFANFGGTAIHSPEQGVHFALVTMRDVTSRRRNETELVRRARKLEQLNEELRRFASVVSHDLQAPMRLISSNLDLLAEDFGSSDRATHCHLDRAREAAIRMREMIRGVLDLNELGADEPYQPQRVEATAAARMAIAALEEEIYESCAEVSCERLPTVAADPAWLADVFERLIQNAIHHGGKRVQVVIDAVVADNGDRVISVRDNGPGIPLQDRQRVFRLFYTMDRPTQPHREHAGIGVGLVWCRKILDLMNGAIWVEDAPEGGAALRFVLPPPPETD